MTPQWTSVRRKMSGRRAAVFNLVPGTCYEILPGPSGKPHREAGVLLDESAERTSAAQPRGTALHLRHADWQGVLNLHGLRLFVGNNMFDVNRACPILPARYGLTM